MPSSCLLCGTVGPDALCAGCDADLPRMAAACAGCALPLEGVSGGARRCGRCLRRAPPWDEAACPFEYAPPVDYLIQRLKFNGDLACGRVLGLRMADALAEAPGGVPEVIVPIPLHRARLARRGFNQAAELARPIASRLGVPLDARLCERTRATAEQTSLDALRRRRNVRNAFAIAGRAPADVAIVDDVVTTGATAAELALALRRAGARRIRLWLCARARPSRS